MLFEYLLLVSLQFIISFYILPLEQKPNVLDRRVVDLNIHGCPGIRQPPRSWHHSQGGFLHRESCRPTHRSPTAAVERLGRLSVDIMTTQQIRCGTQT